MEGEYKRGGCEPQDGGFEGNRDARFSMDLIPPLLRLFYHMMMMMIRRGFRDFSSPCFFFSYFSFSFNCKTLL